MRVICKSNKGFEIDMDLCTQYAQSIAYELSKGKIYTVYGQSLVHGCLKYLVDPGDRPGLRRPNWYPCVWFSVVENSIPTSWVFSYTGNSQGPEPLAIWGYPELATQHEHFEDLIERKEEAILTFLKRAGEIDMEQDRRNDMD